MQVILDEFISAMQQYKLLTDHTRAQEELKDRMT